MTQEKSVNIEWVDIVNEENEIIAQATRQQMRSQNLRHRATYIVVHDGMGKILVQHRTETKDFYPGKLDATAGGVVVMGESMLESARREAEEELGIAGFLLRNTGFSIMRKISAVHGEGYSAVSATGHLRYRKKRFLRFTGCHLKKLLPVVINLRLTL
ncbi:NUDIX hydrolase YfcD [Xenorhabdus siamensis]|uniref:NUDIX hydrolase YfcD n=1 Tax=Xenorhabdus siamensis TaxID=3136254 RepID=UPI0030F3931A